MTYSRDSFCLNFFDMLMSLCKPFIVGKKKEKFQNKIDPDYYFTGGITKLFDFEKLYKKKIDNN